MSTWDQSSEIGISRRRQVALLCSQSLSETKKYGKKFVQSSLDEYVYNGRMHPPESCKMLTGFKSLCYS